MQFVHTDDTESQTSVQLHELVVFDDVQAITIIDTDTIDISKEAYHFAVARNADAVHQPSEEDSSSDHSDYMVTQDTQLEAGVRGRSPGQHAFWTSLSSAASDSLAQARVTQDIHVRI